MARILRIPPMLLALALLLIPFTLATPVDVSPPYTSTESQVKGSFTPIFIGLKGHGSLETRGDDDKLKTGDHDCEKDFPQFYKIYGEMRDIFQEAAYFRANSQKVCNAILPKFYKSKVTSNEYTLSVGDADIYVSKTNVLWNRNLRVVYKLTLTDKGYGKVHAKKDGIPQKDLNKLCVEALETYGTKGKGCTKDQPEFINAQKNEYDKDKIVTLKVSFEKPKNPR
ncbi:uncharacterized protein BDW70DRAFT_160240 [Aspergillus foveolatus]|uniref:uncharacterized protein n=1 Tax=Aspergillus foveolatus TaxID=210207 RepID=UPI003CCCE32B